MIKSLLKKASVALLVGLAVNSALAATSLSKDQIHQRIQTFFSGKGITKISYLMETPDLTVVNATTPNGPMMVTFFGENREYFVQNTPYKVNYQTKKFAEVRNAFIRDYIASQEANLVVVKAPHEKGKIYAVININCPHCHDFIHNAQSLTAKGYTLVLAPIVNSSVPQEGEKTTYIFTQPASKRFELLGKDMRTMPAAKSVSPYIRSVTDKLVSYGVNSYPILISEDGLVSEGWVNADRAMQELNLK